MSYRLTTNVELASRNHCSWGTGAEGAASPWSHIFIGPTRDLCHVFPVVAPSSVHVAESWTLSSGPAARGLRPQGSANIWVGSSRHVPAPRTRDTEGTSASTQGHFKERNRQQKHEKCGTKQARRGTLVCSEGLERGQKLVFSHVVLGPERPCSLNTSAR